MITSIANTQALTNHLAESSVPVLVDFYTDWCAPCQAQAPILERFAASHAGEVSVVKVNIEENAELASTYGVRSIPTLTLFENGAPVETRVGLSNAGQLEDLINR